jgi:hypothetical protein
MYVGFCDTRLYALLACGVRYEVDIDSVSYVNMYTANVGHGGVGKTRAWTQN